MIRPLRLRMHSSGLVSSTSGLYLASVAFGSTHVSMRPASRFWVLWHHFTPTYGLTCCHIYLWRALGCRFVGRVGWRGGKTLDVFGSEFGAQRSSRCVGLVLLCILVGYVTPRELDSKPRLWQCRFVGFGVRKHSQVVGKVVLSVVATQPKTTKQPTTAFNHTEATRNSFQRRRSSLQQYRNSFQQHHTISQTHCHSL
jgi:hypothetical protein